MTDTKYTEDQVESRFYELFPYDDPLTSWEIEWIASQDDLDAAVSSVYNARLRRTEKKQSKTRSEYWHPLKGIKDRWQVSLDNETNPIIGIENVFVPAIAGTLLLRDPVRVAGAILGGSAATGIGDFASQALTGKSLSTHIQELTGLSKFTSDRINPLGWIGGWAGKKEAARFAQKYLNKWLSKINLPVQFTPEGATSVLGRTAQPVPGQSVIPTYYSLIQSEGEKSEKQKKKLGGKINYLTVF